jgi:oligopeptide/dipeptide ABC transporter ATP-binding protein
MYLGHIVEIADREALFEDPRHPYTQALRAAIPEAGRGRRRHPALPGEVPSPLNPPTGCPFHTRCPKAEDSCRALRPFLEPIAPGADHLVACPLAAPR